jgi:hypothetical protein
MRPQKTSCVPGLVDDSIATRIELETKEKGLSNGFASNMFYISQWPKQLQHHNCELAFSI